MSRSEFSEISVGFSKDSLVVLFDSIPRTNYEYKLNGVKYIIVYKYTFIDATHDLCKYIAKQVCEQLQLKFISSCRAIVADSSKISFTDICKIIETYVGLISTRTDQSIVDALYYKIKSSQRTFGSPRLTMITMVNQELVEFNTNLVYT